MDLARGGLIDSGENLDQRGLAGTVVADQGHDLPGMDLEIDVGQRRDGAEILGNAAQAQDWRAGDGGVIGLDGHRSRSPWIARMAPGRWPGAPHGRSTGSRARHRSEEHTSE